jgi:large subunit ribosomal protein L22
MTSVLPERPEVRAVAKWVRISPRKARLVIDHIRGRTVPEARTVLAFTSRAAAREIQKVLGSAVANAEANHGFVGDDMVVSEAYVDDGLIIKRWRPRARGRVARIKKRTCHITIKLVPVDGAVPAVAPPEPETEPIVEEVEAEEAEAQAGPEPEADVAPEPEDEAAPEPEAQVQEEPEAKPETEPETKPKRRVRRKKAEED